ncbi:pinensin family lanthipeptide [Longimicrobium terrae]|uniref:Uncharacterized protein n=1 Tax=Longimicrobium terrae TaxID=1639882 RepID=A0A841GUT1_9BACT|nr:pinensin family lanthipeptide [Longimicrobium terrae]MBB4634843.1 hypothetical protein [Longimicrobium terrae]MBB6069238.1 hypothetical protein [Longimicrobium terrae]NNC31952.1 hypothetical protein [Longimicrobium terrae]
MKKLALSLEHLTVESFATSESDAIRGTALGHMYVTPTEDTAGIPCTGESCRGLCSQQICPAEPIVGVNGLQALMIGQSGATPCFSNETCNCA